MEPARNSAPNADDKRGERGRTNRLGLGLLAFEAGSAGDGFEGLSPRERYRERERGGGGAKELRRRERFGFPFLFWFYIKWEEGH